jgi:hypothetical protein
MLCCEGHGCSLVPCFGHGCGRRHAHSEVYESTLFEAAAAALGSFRKEGWADKALTPNAILRVEVQIPPVIHEVPVKTIKQWLTAPSASPKEQVTKQRLR